MKLTQYFLRVLAFWLCLSTANAARIGDHAPAFTGKDTYAKTHKLSDYQGKFVVLEWHNHDCPFTMSQYKGKMQRLQQIWTGRGVIWLRVISSAPGKEGYVTAKRANLDAARNGTAATATLLDPSGVIGHAYGAKTTPHMFVIDPKGILIYDGAIDNAPLVDEMSDKTEDGKTYVNYVDRALEEATSGRNVSIKTTIPYGCSVKYK
ncbi:MAG TPA: redoxin domain-containing protein [bacterium]|nr:redoxin domain-containing protein [bacterium]